MTTKQTDNKKSTLLAGKKILIIEDDQFISRVYSKWLTHSGAIVSVAFNGALGLKALEKEPADLILLDLGMPGLDGHSTITKLRENPQTKDTPVIVLSNTTIKESKDGFKEIREAGVKDILRKYETSLTEIVECISSYFPTEVNR